MNKIKTSNFINLPIFAILDSELKNNKIKRDFHYIKLKLSLVQITPNCKARKNTYLQTTQKHHMLKANHH